MPPDTKDLPIEQDLPFQRREWWLQRAGSLGLGTFVAAAMLGLFGSGPLSHARAGDPGSLLWIEYERFVRIGAAARLTVHFASERSEQGRRELRINRDYFESLRVHRIVPEPARTVIAGEEVTLSFDLSDPAAGSTVIFDVEPLAAGRQSARVATGTLPAVPFAQFVYF